MSKARDREEFVAVLAREFAEVSPKEIARLARALMLGAGRLHLLCVAMCNGETPFRPQDATCINCGVGFWDDYRRGHSGLCPVCAEVRKLISGAEEVTKDNGTGFCGLGIETNRDPRGPAVKVTLPSGQSNSFAGEFWCVPQ